MHAWEQIQLTLDYMEEHLDEDITIEKLAGIASLSPFYYQRLFTRLVKKPAAEYMKLRRMARAVDALLQKDKRILDIALDLGFSSHELFSRTFKDTFGMTPQEYRNHPQTLNRMTKPELLLSYTLIDEGVPLITDGIVIEINRRKLTEPVPFFGYDQKMPVTFIDGLGTESGVDPLDTLWRKLHKEKEAISDLLDGQEELGMTLPCAEKGFFLYFAGARARTDAACDGRFIRRELPAGDYLVCSFEAENFESLVMDALYKAQQYIYGTWLPGHSLETEPFCAERYQSHSPETTGMELWMKCLPQQL